MEAVMKMISVFIGLMLSSSAVMAFQLSDLDPTYKHSAVRAGLRAVDPSKLVKPNSPNEITDPHMYSPPANNSATSNANAQAEEAARHQAKLDQLQQQIESLKKQQEQQAQQRKMEEENRLREQQAEAARQMELKRAEEEKAQQGKQAAEKAEQESRLKAEEDMRHQQEQQAELARQSAQEEQLQHEQMKQDLKLQEIQALGELFKALGNQSGGNQPPAQSEP